MIGPMQHSAIITTQVCFLMDCTGRENICVLIVVEELFEFGENTHTIINGFWPRTVCPLLHSPRVPLLCIKQTTAVEENELFSTWQWVSTLPLFYPGFSKPHFPILPASSKPTPMTDLFDLKPPLFCVSSVLWKVCAVVRKCLIRVLWLSQQVQKIVFAADVSHRWLAAIRYKASS